MAESTAVARPLRELVPLIKEELDAGNEERERAGVEHYKRAGEMLLEAKEQVGHGEWSAWLKRNFHLSATQAKDYMRLVGVIKTTPLASFSSLREATRPNAKESRVPWHKPVREITERVNVDHLARERQNRQHEQELLRKLSHQLIDIGYKVLASKLHPDKGGSSEAMARLNKVRNILKGAI